MSYHQGPAYGAQKAGADKMAADMAKELRPYGVAAMSIWMGGLDTERARAHMETLAPEQRAALPPRESPQFTGRVIAALYGSGDMMAFSGRASSARNSVPTSTSPTSMAAVPAPSATSSAAHRSSTRACCSKPRPASFRAWALWWSG